MVEHRIPYANWTTELANAIEIAEEGDTIYVHDEAMKMMAESAIYRMRPDTIFNIVVENNDDNG